MDTTEIEKGIVVITNGIVEYLANSVVIKTILNKSTGTISAVSVDSGEGMGENIIPFDTFVQIIDGKAELVISDISHFLETGQSIIIPAHSRNWVQPHGRFKMIMTFIKSGYIL